MRIREFAKYFQAVRYEVHRPKSSNVDVNASFLVLGICQFNYLMKLMILLVWITVFHRISSNKMFSRQFALNFLNLFKIYFLDSTFNLNPLQVLSRQEIPYSLFSRKFLSVNCNFLKITLWQRKIWTYVISMDSNYLDPKLRSDQDA